MKNYLLFSFLLISCLPKLDAQDIITFTNGDQVKAKILEIGTTEITYKKFDYQAGPTYTVSKSDVFMVKYPNGDKDMFSNTGNASLNLNKSTISSNQRELKAGTNFQIELLQTLSSKVSTTGQVVSFRVKLDVEVDGKILIKAGEELTGLITASNQARELGREGGLEVQVTQVKAIDESIIQLSGNIHKAGDNRSVESIGIAALIFWPALFIKGKEAEIPAGTIFITSVAQTAVITVN